MRHISYVNLNPEKYEQYLHQKIKYCKRVLGSNTLTQQQQDRLLLKMELMYKSLQQ